MKKTRKNLLWAVLWVLCAMYGPAWAEWTEPVLVPEVSTSNLERSCFLSYDLHSLYITRKVSGREYIYQAKREGTSGPFSSPVKVFGPSWDVQGAWVSPDNLRMYYKHELPSRWYLEMSERSSVDQPWPAGTRVSEINAYGAPSQPSLTADELIIVFTSHNITGGQGGYDLWMAARESLDSPFGPLVNLSEINSTYDEGGPSISPDGLVLYFASGRNGVSQLFRATRESVEDPFSEPELLSFFGSPAGNPSVSSDGRAIYFIREGDVYVSYRIPQPVAVDIKPGSCPNPLNLASRGVLPVAILGSDDLDVNAIDVASIRLAGAAPVRSSFEDVAAPVSDGNECECTTEASDSYTDLTLKFKTQQIVEQIVNLLGELVDGELLVLNLAGALSDGTPIEGTDCIVVVGKVPRPLAARSSDINTDGIVDILDFSKMAKYWLEPTAADY